MLPIVFRRRGVISLTVSLNDGRAQAYTIGGNIMFDTSCEQGLQLRHFRAECRSHLVRNGVCSPNTELVLLQSSSVLKGNRTLAPAPKKVKKALRAACANFACVAVKTAFFRARVHAWVCGCVLAALHARQS